MNEYIIKISYENNIKNKHLIKGGNYNYYEEDEYNYNNNQNVNEDEEEYSYNNEKEDKDEYNYNESLENDSDSFIYTYQEGGNKHNKFNKNKKFNKENKFNKEGKNEMFYKGLKYKTDKITHHGYHRFYDFFLKQFKNKKINLLEIGIDDGRSLQMWRDYFPDGKIYGFDLKKSTKYSDKKNIYEITGDQSSGNDLENIIKEIKCCDIIIDDGSHVPEHQLFSFNILFKNLLKEGGVYIIEDIETSYWTNSELYGYKINSGLKSKKNIVNIFKDVVDVVNATFIDKNKIKEIKNNSPIDFDVLNKISYIMFGQNCIIINKMTEEEYNFYYKKEYRFKSNIG